MRASKTLTTAIAAATLVGAIGLAYAQSADEQPAPMEPTQATATETLTPEQALQQAPAVADPNQAPMEPAAVNTAPAADAVPQMPAEPQTQAATPVTPPTLPQAAQQPVYQSPAATTTPPIDSGMPAAPLSERAPRTDRN